MRLARSATLLLLAALAGLGLRVHDAAAFGSMFYATIYFTDIASGETAPQSLGPMPISGGVGSTGVEGIVCDAGRMTGFGFVTNPISGLSTPQIEAHNRADIDVYDISCPGMRTDLAEPYHLVLHTRLSGSLLSIGPHPYEAFVTLTAQTADAGDVATGTISESGSGLQTSGVLLGAPSTLSDYPVDLPITIYLSGNEVSDILFLSMELFAGGTALGTDINSASADFRGRGWEFESNGPLFSGLPPGVTLNIPSLNVVDNHWLGPVAGVGPQARGRTFALAAGQNPVRGAARFTLTLPADGAARVDVFDVRGARMATLLDGWTEAGAHTLDWNAAAAPAGVYFVRAEAGRARTQTRIVVAR